MPLPYTYHYAGKIRKTIVQFMRIFSGIEVEFGVDRDADTFLDRKTVEVKYGSMDRVVADVLTKNGTFVASSLPLISCYLTSIEPNAEARRSRKHEENIRYDNAGVKHVASKIMGTPYIVTFDVNIWASNTEQMFQILEQILLVFNPRLTMQTGEELNDWSFMTYAELTGIVNEENIPTDTQSRTVVQTLNFSSEIWLNYPLKDYTKIINDIYVNMNDNTNNPVFLEEVHIDATTPL